MSALRKHFFPLRAAGACAALAIILSGTGCTDHDDRIQAPPPASQPAAAFPAEVATRWFSRACELVGADSLKPPVAARVYGYTGVALYSAVVGGMPHHVSLAGLLNQLSDVPVPDRLLEYHWPSVANAAVASLLDSLLREHTHAAVHALRNEITAEYALSVSPEVMARSAALGLAVGAAVSAWAASDGYPAYHDCAYSPPSGSGLWEPTPPSYAAALEPCWGQMRAFTLLHNDECMCPGHTPYDTSGGSGFYAEAREVYDAVNNCSPDDSAIVFFWADDPVQSGTPGGHSLMILTQVLSRGGFSLETAAEAYARMGVAVADAFISCWRAKYTYNLCRPVTYIRAYIDPAWNPLIITPGFPEYTSGHSVQSAAAAEVLNEMFGAHFAFTDSTHYPRLQPRSYSSFSDFANEAAVSRLYGGIHYRDAIEAGLEQGRCIGARANALPLRAHG